MTDLVLLRWFDSTVAPALELYNEQDITEVKLFVLETVGFLIGEADAPYGGHYVIAATRHSGTDWRGVQLIPKANVVEKITLGEKP